MTYFVSTPNIMTSTNNFFIFEFW